MHWVQFGTHSPRTLLGQDLRWTVLRYKVLQVQEALFATPRALYIITDQTLQKTKGIDLGLDYFHLLDCWFVLLLYSSFACFLSSASFCPCFSTC